MLLATMLLPAQLAAVPQFQTMALLGWVGSLKALIIPGAANAFGIFWMRQYFQNSIHDELVEAATLDGCGFLGSTGMSRCRRPGRRWRSSASSRSSRPGTTTSGR